MTALNNPKAWFVLALLACLLMAMLLVIKHHNAVALQLTHETASANPCRFLNKLLTLV
jgi:hypothetical protein